MEFESLKITCKDSRDFCLRNVKFTTEITKLTVPKGNYDMSRCFLAWNNNIKEFMYHFGAVANIIYV